MITRKKVIKFYFIIIGIFAIAFIIVGGNKKTNIVTSNVNNVKSVLSTRIVQKEDEEKVRLVRNVNEIKKYGLNSKIKFIGTLTGYGPDCPGCGGHVACRPNPDVRNGNIYYTDKEYGKIRILAADYSIPCGSIIHISNFKFVPNKEFVGIVLDRGSAIVGLTMDLLYPSEADTVIIGRQRNIEFEVLRWGWK
jgi:3D (Asp-Asp-Asp) domain-containing protein